MKSAGQPSPPNPLTSRLTGAELSRFYKSSGGSWVPVSLDADRGDTQPLKDYVFLDHVLSDAAADAVESRVRTETGWTLNEKWFLSKHDVVWARRAPGKGQSQKVVPELVQLRDLGKRLIEGSYNTVVGARFEIKATKMLVGQAVGIHNDSPAGARGRTEGYRLLYYPNRAYSDSHGGHLLFFASDAGPIIGGIRPLFNSGVLMCLSDRSFHAVTRVAEGVRYTVAVLYWDYPLLFEDAASQGVVRRCLQKVIASGLEEVPFGSTTVAYHLYHTYRLLVEWGMPLNVCVAGMMRQISGYQGNPGRAIGVSINEIGRLADDYTVQLINGLDTNTSRGIDRLDRDIRLVKLAAGLEQAEDGPGIAKVCRFIEKTGGLGGEVGRRIGIEIDRIRSEIVSAGI